MSKPANRRKSQFRAALALAEKTAAQWAAENDITPGHLSQVLAGKKESRSLLEKVEAFTRKYVKVAA
jgi:hypothetical protein